MADHAKRFLALDLGASNGRGLMATFDGEWLTLDEIYRFENRSSQVGKHLYWDVLWLWGHIKQALAKAVAASDEPITSLAVDSWGVDFALLDKGGGLLSNPYCYRDPQTRNIYERIFKRVAKEKIFAIAGLQFMETNSLAQLAAIQESGSPPLVCAATFLHIADLFSYWLTGIAVSEYTMASTSQLLDARERRWSTALIRDMDLPEAIFPPLVMPGTSLGPLQPVLVQELGLDKVSVTATASHDTASAVVAVPAEGSNFAYISSGTWALLGTELDQPLLDDRAFAHNLANEGGVFHTIRLLRNIANMWFLQECRNHWAALGSSYSWSELLTLATQEAPFRAFINPDDPAFFAPGDMPSRIRHYCQATDQAVPETDGAVVRIILESLAFRYREVLEEVEVVVGHRLSPLHIVSGGSRNRLLNQFAANATSRPVIAGPHEATAIGNIMMQLVASGDLATLDEARSLVARSFPVETFLPQESDRWDEEYHRYLTVR